MSELLNDDSFIYWVNEDDRLSDSDKMKWDKWLSSAKENRHILNRAKKIINMPFNETDADVSVSEELRRLKEAIKKSDDDTGE